VLSSSAARCPRSGSSCSCAAQATTSLPLFLAVAAALVLASTGRLRDVDRLDVLGAGVVTCVWAFVAATAPGGGVGVTGAVAIVLGYGVVAAVALGLGTLVFPFATRFLSHALSAFLVFAAFALLWLVPARPAGYCCGPARRLRRHR
jgi:hypothetical protein